MQICAIPWRCVEIGLILTDWDNHRRTSRVSQFASYRCSLSFRPATPTHRLDPEAPPCPAYQQRWTTRLIDVIEDPITILPLMCPSNFTPRFCEPLESMVMTQYPTAASIWSRHCLIPCKLKSSDKVTFNKWWKKKKKAYLESIGY